MSHASEAQPEPNAEPAPKDRSEKEAKGNGPDEVKPEGRLLPWEPPVQSAETVDHDTADEDRPKE